MVVYANQRVGTVLECHESKARVAQAMAEFTNIQSLIISDDMLEDNYYYDIPRYVRDYV